MSVRTRAMRVKRRVRAIARRFRTGDWYSAAVDLERTTTALLTGLFDPANAEAWQAFDRRYRPILIGFARSCGLGDHDAAEVAQDTILRFVEQYRAGMYDRSRGRLGTWLVTIARYRVLDMRHASNSLASIRDGTAVVLHDDRSVQEAYEGQRRLAILREAILELQQHTRVEPRTIRAFELLYYQGMSAQAVAADLGMSVQDVYLARSRVAARVREIVARIELAYDEMPAEPGVGERGPSSLLGN